MNDRYAIAVVSGGLDSTTMVYDLLSEGYRVDMLSFNYGQRHRKELRYAQMTAVKLALRHDVVDLSHLAQLISNSALTSNGGAPAGSAFPERPDIEVPDGHYAEDTMKQTVVPNRNMIMISIAAGVAVNRQATTVAVGVHSGDHFIYPDCRPQFMAAVGQAILAGNEGFHNFVEDLDPANPIEAKLIEQGAKYFSMPLTTPYLTSTKADIAYRALELRVPLSNTWSCYKGGENHCGRCGTCVERLEAIDEAMKLMHEQGRNGFVDNTQYADSEFWKLTVHIRNQQAEAKKMAVAQNELNN